MTYSMTCNDGIVTMNGTIIYDVSPWWGATIIVCGIILLVASAFKMMRQIENGTEEKEAARRSMPIARCGFMLVAFGFVLRIAPFVVMILAMS